MDGCALRTDRLTIFSHQGRDASRSVKASQGPAYGIVPVHWTHVIAEQLPLLVEVHHLRFASSPQQRNSMGLGLTPTHNFHRMAAASMIDRCDSTARRDAKALRTLFDERRTLDPPLTVKWMMAPLVKPVTPK